MGVDVSTGGDNADEVMHGLTFPRLLLGGDVGWANTNELRDLVFSDCCLIFGSTRR